MQPNIDDRFASYENYCAIFNYILNSNGPVTEDLPVQWLWDLIDEFVWQFSSFAQWRSRPKGKTDEEIALLTENPSVWSCYSVLNVLYSLIQKSKIQDQMRATKRGEEVTDELIGEYGAKPLYRLLGLFSLVTLVRVHALLGDYTLALRMLDDIDMKRLPTREVPAAHVSVHYHVGFSYLMLGRHADAIYHLSKGYFFHAGPRRGRAAASGSDAIAKQADRMLALLAVAHALSPTKWDDSREVREAREALRQSEKYNDQFETMSRGGLVALPVFEELFRYGAPKSISPFSPSYAAYANQDQDSLPDPINHTVQLFIKEVRNVIDVPDLRILLKLYTSIGIKKLATLAGKDEEELVRELMVLKGSMKTVKWTEAGSEAMGSGLLNGEEAIVGSLGFAVEDNTINITEQKRARQFAGRFLSQGVGAKQLLEQRESAAAWQARTLTLSLSISQSTAITSTSLCWRSICTARPASTHGSSRSKTAASCPDRRQVRRMGGNASIEARQHDLSHDRAVYVLENR